MTPLEWLARIASALERIAEAVAGGNAGSTRPNLREALALIAATRFPDHTRYGAGCDCLACHARRTLEGL